MCVKDPGKGKETDRCVPRLDASVFSLLITIMCMTRDDINKGSEKEVSMHLRFKVEVTDGQ